MSFKWFKFEKEAGQQEVRIKEERHPQCVLGIFNYGYHLEREKGAYHWVIEGARCKV